MLSAYVGVPEKMGTLGTLKSVEKCAPPATWVATLQLIVVDLSMRAVRRETGRK